MTSEQAGGLAPGTKVWTVDYSQQGFPARWNVNPAIILDTRGLDYEYVNLHEMEAEDPVQDSYRYPVECIHATRLVALRWVAEQLAWHRRKLDEAWELLAKEMTEVAANEKS